MAIPGPPSPRKAGQATSRASGVEVESSGAGAAASNSPRTIKAPNFARVVVPSVSPSRKRQRPTERERLVLKVPRKAATTTTATTSAATGGAVDPPPRIIPLNPIPSTPEGVVQELIATQNQLEAAREELARVRASEKSYEKAVAEWKALATDLRRQVDVAAEKYQRASDGWSKALQSLHREVRERDDEVVRLRHSLAQAAAQGQGSERDQLLIAQLKRRVTREYLLSLGVAGC